MASARFTRDEAILALDAYFSLQDRRLASDCPEIIQLSEELQILPIHPRDGRRLDFRNPTGVCNQLRLFRAACNTGHKDANLGQIFLDVAFEYEERHNELHEIAETIRSHQAFFQVPFGATFENVSFPEGALLEHLHRVVEKRDGTKTETKECCEICSIKPEMYYQPCGTILEQHLLIAPTAINGHKRYSANDFITVCPNCHAVLHRYRPWRNRENCGDLLR